MFAQQAAVDDRGMEPKPGMSEWSVKVVGCITELSVIRVSMCCVCTDLSPLHVVSVNLEACLLLHTSRIC